MKISNPSYLIIAVIATIENDRYTNLRFLLRKKNNDRVTIKMYNGSVMPNNEFMISRGSKTNKDAPNSEYLESINRLQKK